MKTFLVIFFAAILISMLAVTAWAGSHISLFEVGDELLSSPWWIATLFDAYFGFLTFYCWVFYKEPGWPARVMWLAAILSLGNIAMAAYVLLQLSRWKTGEPVERLLLR